MAWRKGLGIFGVTAAAANFGYGVKKGSEGGSFTHQDVFNPPETLGKLVGRVVKTHNDLQQQRGQGESELHTIRMKNATPSLTTNHPHPPVFSEEVDKRIKSGVSDLYKT